MKFPERCSQWFQGGKVDIPYALHPLRFIARLYGLTPYRITENGLLTSKLGLFYSLLWATFFGSIFVLEWHGSLGNMRKRMLFSHIMTMNQFVSMFSCIVSLLRHGFDQSALVQYIDILRLFDEETGYLRSRNARKDCFRLRLVTWILLSYTLFSYLFMVLFVVVLYKRTEFFLDSLKVPLMSSVIIADLITFRTLAMMLGHRLRFFNRMIKGKSDEMPGLCSSKIRELYGSLFRAATVLKKHYGFIFVFEVIHICGFLICRTFSLLYVNYIFEFFVCGYISILMYLIGIISLAMAAQFVRDEGEMTAIILLEGNIESLNDIKQGRQERVELSLYMSLVRWEFSAVGLFNVDLSLCNTILMMNVMFLPVLAKLSYDQTK